MAVGLDQLREIMGDPVYVPARVPWELAPAELGVQLPSDYRSFIDTYGAVDFAGEWFVKTPTLRSSLPGGPGGLAGWRYRNDTALRIQVEQSAELLGLDPTPVFPDPGGLLAWGANSNHVYCCWSTTDPDPNRWPVVVWFQDRGRFECFDGGFAEFVATVLSGAYAMENELLVRPDPEDWDPEEMDLEEWDPAHPLWIPGADWAATQFTSSWSSPQGSTEMPWTRLPDQP